MVARRQFLIALGTSAFAPLVTFAQLKGRIWRIGFFYNGSRQSALDAGAGLKVCHVDVASQNDLEPAISKLVQQRAGAFIILGNSFFVQHAKPIAEVANRYRLPSIYTGAEYPQAGGLMSYGPNFSENYRRAAAYVDKILKGSKPGDLPFEQPTRFFLTINRKTAKVLGIAFSNELLMRADTVIK